MRIYFPHAGFAAAKARSRLPSLCHLNLRLYCLLGGAFLCWGTFTASGQFACQVRELWRTYYNASYSGDDWATGLTVDSGANVYVTGRATRGASGVPGFATVKYDAAGIGVWTNRYNGHDDVPSAIAVDNTGNVYVAGFSGLPPEGYAIVKYNADGLGQWTNRYPGTFLSDGTLVAVALDKDGNIYMSGDEYYGLKRFILKYAPDGTAIWTNHLQNAYTTSKAFAVDSEGNAYAVLSPDGAQHSCMVIKFNSQAQVVWTNGFRFPDPVYYDYRYEVSALLERDGNVYMTGVASAATRPDYYLTLKYDPNGNAVWTNQAPGSGGGYPERPQPLMGVDHDGNVFLAQPGFLTLKLDFNGHLAWTNDYHHTPDYGGYVHALAVDQSGNVYVAGESIYTNHYTGIATVKFDAITGNQIWAARCDDVENHLYAMRVDAQNNVYITGLSWVSGATARDFLTIKYGQFLVPELEILHTKNQVVLSWPTLATNAILEMNTKVVSAQNWARVTNAPAVISSRNFVTNDIEPGTRFYRLRLP